MVQPTPVMFTLSKDGSILCIALEDDGQQYGDGIPFVIVIILAWKGSTWEIQGEKIKVPFDHQTILLSEDGKKLLAEGGFEDPFLYLHTIG